MWVVVLSTSVYPNRNVQQVKSLIKRQRIFITGRVQGVGFRPAVYRLARQLALSGFVCNDTKGVTIELQGSPDKIAEFLRNLQSNRAAPAAQIESCTSSDIETIKTEDGFVISPSDYEGTALSHVTPDMVVCSDCLQEMATQQDFRFAYPFINCTNCGPRYSIIKTIPYDRPNTTMSAFAMCQTCAGQYAEVSDRRFHAQPVACPTCGPKVTLTDSSGKTIETESDKATHKAAQMLLQGNIVAIKGIGGFHLAVNALNNEAVLKLRQRKRRDHKPFAMMADSINKIKKYALVSEKAEQLLKSIQSPIVLLPMRPDSPIAPAVAAGVETYGFMLCYAPLHYLLFDCGLDVLVMTSGNISDEPLICENDKALEKLGNVANAFLMHDRDIYRQVDDSIVHFIGDEPVLLRRARGYVPTPVLLPEPCTRDIFAVGPDLKNTFCFVKSNQLICSEHIGDLEDAEVYHHYLNSIQHLKQLFEVEPEVVVCDLHPGYFSTQHTLAMRGVQAIQVQHHWAHIASVMAEYNQKDPVIGLVCDGTGYGIDGKIWGCECLIASLQNFERFAHLDYYMLPGADKAAKEAIRPVLGLLRAAYGDDCDLNDFAGLLDPIEPDKTKRRVIWQQLDKEINTTETSSLGRVFDAVAAMLGLGTYNNFEAQLPMALEAIAEETIEQGYDFELKTSSGKPLLLDISNMIRQIISNIRNSVPRGVISAKFHNCLCSGLVAMVEKANRKTGINTVALSGGVFCNRYLTNRLIKRLRDNSFKVLFNRQYPSNDGGISVGQAAIAADLVIRSEQSVR